MSSDKNVVPETELDNEVDFEGGIDQTSFIDAAVFTNQRSQKKDAAINGNSTSRKTLTKNKKILIGIGITVSLSFVVLLLWAMSRSMRPIPTAPIETLAPAIPVDDGFTKKINDAEFLLKEADPSIEEYQLPPVNLGLRLDPSEKR